MTQLGRALGILNPLDFAAVLVFTCIYLYDVLSSRALCSLYNDDNDSVYHCCAYPDISCLLTLLLQNIGHNRLLHSVRASSSTLPLSTHTRIAVTLANPSDSDLN